MIAVLFHHCFLFHCQNNFNSFGYVEVNMTQVIRNFPQRAITCKLDFSHKLTICVKGVKGKLFIAYPSLSFFKSVT